MTGSVGRGVWVLTVSVLLVPLAGCSSTPDWANPVEWYKGTHEAIVDTDEEAEKAGKKDESAESPIAAETPGKDEPFPNLASVPERPEAPSEVEKDAMERQLIADRENARYSDDRIALQAEQLPPAPSPPPSPPSAPQPPSPASQERQSTSAPSQDSSDSAERASSEGGSSGNAAGAAAAAGTAAAAATASADDAGTPPPDDPPSTPPSTKQTAAEETTEDLQPPPAPIPEGGPPQAASTPPPASEPLEARSVTQRPPERSPVTRPATPAHPAPSVESPKFGEPPADIAAALGAAGPARSQDDRVRPPFAADSRTRAVPAAPGQPEATLTFKDGSSSLDAKDRDLLRRVAAEFKDRGGTIRVVGHASSGTRSKDPVRHHMVNFDISLDRANAVAGALMRMGVPANALSIVARSDTDPMYHGTTPAGEAGNRRVEVYFVN